MKVKTDILLRVRITYLAVALFTIAAVYRLVIIQYVESEKWRGLGQTNGLKVMKINATRGNIYADDGSLLATSLPFYKVAFDPALATQDLFDSQIDSLSYLLSQYFKNLSSKEYKAKITEQRKIGRRYMVINQNLIDYQEKKKMEKWPIFRKGRLSGGIIFEKVEKRFLPFSQLGGRTIGTVNGEHKGLVGLEYSFNKELSGRDGEALYQKMVGGGWKPIYDGTELRSIEGMDIQTTINVNIQDIAENALLEALEKNQADYGSVVVMEVNTGQIKAISNLSKNSVGAYYESYNYAVGSQGSREPGSTFKLASMIALLEDSHLQLYDSIDTGNGSFKFFNEIMRDHKKGGFGTLSIQEIFEKSSNIGIAKLIQNHFGKNPQEFINQLRAMGLYESLAFQMYGEGKSYIKSPKDSTWSGTSLPWMSHGYELKMTPIHTLTLFNSVANEGKMVQPIIVKYIKRADKVIQNFEAKVLKEKICSESTLRDVKTMLKGVVERGTAHNIYTAKYSIAGKTGTAKNVRNGLYTNEYYTSFVGYFPADKPKYSCIVVIDKPKGYQIYGGDVAAPVFRRIADKIYANEIELQNVEPIKGSQMVGVFPLIKSGNQRDLIQISNKLGISNYSEAPEADWVKTQIVNNSVFWIENDVKSHGVPNVLGMTLKDAYFVLENVGLKVEIQGFGRVKTQSIAPKSKLSSNQKIILKLG
jgi:cell division protein FtsI (penicillin-binding protein 3)